jgi:uncharacterized protein YkwD
MNFSLAPEPMYNFYMTSRLRPTIALLALASLLTFGRAAPAQAESAPAPRFAGAYELIEAVNQYRGQNGLAAYAVSSILMGTAQNQADYNASIGSSTHTGSGGTSYPQRLTAAGYSFVFRSENVLSASPDATGWDLVNDWRWADSDHQHTMLSPNLCEVGAGVSVKGGNAYYVLDASCPSGTSAGNTPVPGATYTGGGGAATQVTVVPNTPKPDGSITHIVQPGETLWSIAITYKTTIAQLKALNNLTDETIYPGDTLIVARAANTQTPSATPTETPAPTVTPFVFRTATRPPEPTATAIPAAPVAGGSGAVIVGAIVALALILAGAMTAVGARKRQRD